MGENFTFCENCRNDVSYSVIEERIKNTLKDEIYEFSGKKAICSECGTEVYIAEIEDANLKSLYDEFRLRNGVISLEKIIEIPNKYNIGKRPLSLLLGWGEMTYSRYCEGDMPTKQYSDILQNIYDDPNYYLTILENNKDRLRSLLAYEKSKRAIINILNLDGERNAKIDEVIDYLLCKCDDITPLALQKALYYIQGFYYAFMGGYLFSDDCEAWIHGPAYREIYYRYCSKKYDTIESNDECDDSKLSSSEKLIIDSVIKNLCCYSGKTLEKFTHSEMPWLSTRKDLSAAVASDRIIEKQLIGDYFLAVKKKYDMLEPSDIMNYSKRMFEKIN